MNKQTKKLIGKLQERLMLLMVRSKEINDAHYLHYADLIEQLQKIHFEEIADTNNINLTQVMNDIRQKMNKNGITEFYLEPKLQSNGKMQYHFNLKRLFPDETERYSKDGKSFFESDISTLLKIIFSWTETHREEFEKNNPETNLGNEIIISKEENSVSV